MPLHLARTWRQAAAQAASPLLAHDDLGSLRGARELPPLQELRAAVDLVDAAIARHLSLVRASREFGFRLYMLKAEVAEPRRIF